MIQNTPEVVEILHSSDWHLMDSQYSTPSRGDDFTKAAMAVVEIAIDRKVAAICNSGDILNTKRPSSRNIEDLAEIDRRLTRAGIPMYVISGNHDASRPSWISILDAKTRTAGKSKVVGIINADDKLINIPDTSLTLFGIPSMGPSKFREIKAWPKANILMSHELIKEFVAFKPKDEELSVADYPEDTYVAFLLGDIHSAKYITTSGDKTVMGYPGSIELCSKNEPADKTVTILRFQDGIVDTISYVPVPSRKALFYRVVTEAQADQALADLLPHIDKDPIVLVKYDSRIPTIPQMFMTVLAGSKALLRCASFAESSAGAMLGLAGENRELANTKSLKDFVANAITPGTELYELAVDLADSEADHKRMITDYVNERMKTYESDTFPTPGLR
jgi:DNA repair exonuclease SbcCD nuclease subunit